jgi:hypothetical protein
MGHKYFSPSWHTLCSSTKAQKHKSKNDEIKLIVNQCQH